MSKINRLTPFYEQDEIIIPHHDGGCKREFEIIKRELGTESWYDMLYQ